jgi:hypothetical protein
MKLRRVMWWNTLYWEIFWLKLGGGGVGGIKTSAALFTRKFQQSSQVAWNLKLVTEYSWSVRIIGTSPLEQLRLANVFWVRGLSPSYVVICQQTKMSKKELQEWWDQSLYVPVVTICTAMFNTHKFYVLPTHCIYVFCVDLRTNSDYFTVQH